jgi:hypothetical protein
VQCISVQTGGLPVIQKPNLVLSEELNGGPIPVKNIQHNPETVLGLCNGRDASKQGFANPFSPKLRTNEDVFQEKPAAPKRGITIEEESVASWLPIPLGYQYTEFWSWSESIACKPLLGDSGGQTFIVCHFVYQCFQNTHVA